MPMVGDSVGVLGFIAVTRSLHFQASFVNADGLTASGIVRAVLGWASSSASHQTVILAQTAALTVVGEVNVVLVVTSAAVPG